MRTLLTCTALLLAIGNAAAQTRTDSAAFIVRLGNDTTSIERYIRTSDQLIIEAVQRSPNTTLHRLVLDMTPQNTVRRAIYAVSRPGSETHLLERTTVFAGDSATVTTMQNGETRTQRLFAGNAIPIVGPFYTPYELAMMR